MDCKEFTSCHAAYIDDTLPGFQMAAMREHLTECARCSRRDAEIRRSLFLLKNLPPVQVSEGFQDRLRARITAEGPAFTHQRSSGFSGTMKWAAAGALLVAIVGVSWADRETRTVVATRLPAVFASVPVVYEGHDETVPAYVASMSTGIPMWPALMLAEEGPLRFAACRRRAGTRQSRIDHPSRAAREPRAVAAILSGMAIATERALRKSIRDRSFERVYYFRGDDDFLKETTARELIGAVLDPATRDFNLELIRGDETSAEAIDTALATPPMFADRRMAVIRDVHGLRKDARVVLERYLAHPAPDLVLLLIDPAGEKEDRALAAAAFVVDFEPLSDDRVPAWIAHHAGTSLGVTISEAAARALHAAAGSELATLAAELDKLASYTGAAAIDEEAVKAVVGVRSGETLADLLDAVADRNAARAVFLVPVVLSQAKANVVTTIMALATQTAAVAWGRAARDRGVPPAGIERGFYALLKEGKAFPGRPWKEAVALWSRASQRWTSPQLERALLDLLAADIAAKESRVSSEEQLLTSLVLALCVQPETRAA